MSESRIHIAVAQQAASPDRRRNVRRGPESAAREHGYHPPGDLGAPGFDTGAGRIGIGIGYDRHYPESMRSLPPGAADLVPVPRAGVVDEWPEGLYEAEMRVAAFQNGYRVALTNRVGAEDRLEFAGEAFGCGPDGTVGAPAERDADEILHAEFDLESARASHAGRLLPRDRRPDLCRGGLDAGGTS